jgi:phosphate transport system substrate-binding protein
LVNAPGAHAYPLINYEYAVVSTKQANPAIAAAIRRFLLWAIAPDETNEKYLQDTHFIPLPAHIWVLSYDQTQSIKSASPYAVIILTGTSGRDRQSWRRRGAFG